MGKMSETEAKTEAPTAEDIKGVKRAVEDEIEEVKKQKTEKNGSSNGKAVDAEENGADEDVEEEDEEALDGEEEGEGEEDLDEAEGEEGEEEEDGEGEEEEEGDD